jgi:hypothetical protein
VNVSVVPKVYVDLSLQLVSGLISPSDFMSRFLKEFKAEERFFEGRAYEVLNSLFYAAEDFVDDVPGQSGVVGKAELYAAARDVLDFTEAQKGPDTFGLSAEGD